MPYYSDTVPDRSVCEHVPQDALVEIYVWDAFMVKRNVSYAGFLVKHSVGRAEVTSGNLPHGRSCYRFAEDEWNTNVKDYLIVHSIPVSIRIVSRRTQPVFSGNERSDNELLN